MRSLLAILFLLSSVTAGAGERNGLSRELQDIVDGLRVRSRPKPKVCECKIQTEADARKHNLEFIRKQTERLEKDIKALEEKQSKYAQSETRAWQKSCDNAYLEDKKEALIRLAGYRSQRRDMGNRHLIMKDLYTSFDPNSCKPKLDCDDVRRAKKNMKMKSKMGVDYESLLESYDDCFFGKMSKFLHSKALQKIDEDGFEASDKTDEKAGQIDNPEIKERCPDDEKKEELKAAKDPEDPNCNCSVIDKPPMPQVLSSGVENSLRKLVDAISCSGHVKCADTPEQFLRELGINTSDGRKPAESVDLSNFFSQPQLQKDTHACMGFTFASNIEAELYRKSIGNYEIPAPDPWEIYGVMSGKTSGKNCKGRDMKVNYKSGVNVVEGFGRLAVKDICLPGADEKIHVGDAVYLRDGKEADLDFFKQALSRDRTLSVMISTEIHNTYEEWVRPVEKGGVPHAVEVVGYGKAVNPISLKEEPYVTIRDSFHDEPCHVRMTFADLKRVLSEVVTVKDVKIVHSEK